MNGWRSIVLLVLVVAGLGLGCSPAAGPGLSPEATSYAESVRKINEESKKLADELQQKTIDATRAAKTPEERLQAGLQAYEQTSDRLGKMLEELRNLKPPTELTAFHQALQDGTARLKEKVDNAITAAQNGNVKGFESVTQEMRGVAENIQTSIQNALQSNGFSAEMWRRTQTLMREGQQ